MAGPNVNPKPSSSDDPSVDVALAEARQSLEDVAESVGSALASSDGSADDFAAVPPGFEMLGDVDLNVSIELGRAEMLVEDVLKLQNGSVVELDKLAGDPVDVFVNGRLVARGEVLVLNDNFCIRISEILDSLQEQVEAVAQEQGASA